MVNDSILSSELFDRCQGIRFAFSTRLGGVSPEPFGMNTSYRVGDRPELVSQNRTLLFSRVGASADAVVIPRQCHSSEVKIVSQGGEVDRTDGLMTDVPNIWLSISVADCVPVFMVDPKRNVICAVHAGWRGSAGMIVQQAIRKMEKEFDSDPEDIRVYIGPSARKCCYEVGPEVAAQFAQDVLERKNGSLYLDLKQETLSQLFSYGVRKEKIEVSPYCTVCAPSLFHSYRRDKERSGRMMGILGMIR